MGFVKYTDSGKSYAAKASLSKAGQLSFTDGARKRFHMDEYKYCILYYDEETLRVGIELTNDENAEGAKKIRFRVTGADVGAKSFMDFFDLGISETTLYPLEKDDETGFLTIDLKSGKQRTSKGASKKS